MSRRRLRHCVAVGARLRDAHPLACTRAPSRCRPRGSRRSGAASWSARPGISRWRWSTSRTSPRRRTASGWSRCGGATGPRRGGFSRRAGAQRGSRRGAPQPGRSAHASRCRRERARARRAPRWRSIRATPTRACWPGELLLRLGRTSDAHWELEKLCAAYPRRADAHAANALVLARLGRPVAAGEQADLALAHRSRSAGRAPGARRDPAPRGRARGGDPRDRAGHRREPRLGRGPTGRAPPSWRRGDCGARRPARSASLVAAAPAATGGPLRDGLRRARPRPGRGGGARTPTTRSRSARTTRRRACVRAEALLRLARAAEARRELARFLDEAPPTMVAERAQAAHDPGQRSAIESPPMPLRLRMLPAPSPGAGPGESPGPTAERAIELADDIERGPDRAPPRPRAPAPLPGALGASRAAGARRWPLADRGPRQHQRDARSTASGWRRGEPRPLAPGAQITLGQITLVFDGTVGAVAGAERTATIARRLVSDLFAGSSDMATPTLGHRGRRPGEAAPAARGRRSPLRRGTGRDLRSAARRRRRSRASTRRSSGCGTASSSTTSAPRTACG